MLVSLPDLRVTVPAASMTLPVWVTVLPFSVPWPEPKPPVRPVKLPPRPKDAPKDQEEELVLPSICCWFWAASKLRSFLAVRPTSLVPIMLLIS